MKNLYVCLIACLFFPGAFLIQQAGAQAPDKMSYQAVVRDNDNELMINTSLGIQISILQGSASGTAVYVEQHTLTSNANGLVTIEIGEGTVVNGIFESIDWSDGPFFIKTETDPDGGTSYSLTETSQLLSVPYALYSKTAGNVSVSGNEGAFDNWDKDVSDDFSGSYNDLTDIPASLPENSVNSSTIQDESVTAADLADETGVAWSDVTSPILIPIVSGEISNISVNAPRAGYVIVTASGFVNWEVTASTTGIIQLAVSTTSGNIEAPVQVVGISGITKVEYYRFPFSITRVFEVSAGTNTFYFNAFHQAVVGQAWVHNHSLVGLYVPTGY